MFGNADCVGLDVLGEIGLLDLSKHAFVQGAIGLGLARQFLIANGRLAQGNGSAFLLMQVLVASPLQWLSIAQSHFEEGPVARQ